MSGWFMANMIEGGHRNEVLFMSISALWQHTSSLLGFVEVSKVFRTLQSLQEPEDIPEMTLLRLRVPHPAAQHVRHRVLHVEAVTQLPVHPAKHRVTGGQPALLVVLELLQPDLPHPFNELRRMDQAFFDVGLGVLVVEDVLVLGVAEVAQDVLGVVGRPLHAYELVQSQLLHESRPESHLNLLDAPPVLEVQLFRLRFPFPPSFL